MVPVVDRRTFVQGRTATYGVAGEGMPVVLLHGWALGQHTYRDVISTIAEQGCRVIAPALPGFGGSADLPGDSFSLRGYALWVAELLDTIGIDEPVVMLGHSFGGGVAVRFAHDHRDRVRSLVLVNSIGGSAWKSGRGLRSIAERPLWDWGLHFPSDVWPIRQATRVLPVGPGRGASAPGDAPPTPAARPPSSAAYSMLLKSDSRTITGLGQKAAAMVLMPSTSLST